MKLTNSSGESIELHVVGYEHPDDELGPTEDNPADDFDPGRFLIVTVAAKARGRSWDGTGAYLDTVELNRFANWLESIRRGQPSHYGIYFTEREMAWSVNYPLTELTVFLWHDLQPPWWDDLNSLPIDFSLTEIDLRDAIRSLRQQALKFPGLPWPN